MTVNMARVTDGAVVNLESWDDSTPETNDLKYVGDKLVMIGDSYENGKFYRSGIEVLSPVEMLAEENQNLVNALAEATELLYQLDMSNISG